MAKTTIDQLPLATGLTGQERVPIAQDTGPGYETKYTTLGAIFNGGIEASYIVAENSFSLPDARVLSPTSGQTTITDNGPGATMVIGLADTAVVPGTYGDSTHIAQITVDATGRITDASQINLTASFLAYLQGLPTTLPAQPNLPWWNGGVLSLS